MLPAIEDISYGFGSMLVSAMDVRELSRKQLKDQLNTIGQKEAQEAAVAAAALRSQRETAQAEVTRLEQAAKDAEELKNISVRTVRDWEEESARISPKALDALVQVLNSINPMDADLEAELRSRAKDMNTAIDSGKIEEYKKTGDRFSDFLKDLMDDEEHSISRPQLARAIAQLAAVDPEQITKAKETLAALSETLPAKQHSLTLRKISASNELQTITLEPGKITSEHVHLMESGALLSDDLYELLKKGLSATIALSAEETKDLDRTLAEKKLEVAAIASGNVTSHVTAGGMTDMTTSDVALPAPVAKDLTIINPSEPAAVSLVVNTPDPSANGVAARLGLKPTPHHERKPALDMNDALTRYADVYTRLFLDYGNEVPPAQNGNALNHIRTMVALNMMGIKENETDKIHQVEAVVNKLRCQLLPLTFNSIDEDLLRQVTGPAREKLERLNQASAALHDHIFEHSREGIDTKTALEELKRWLAEHGITTDQQIKALNQNDTLEEMLHPHELKKHEPLAKRMEQFAAAVIKQSPAIKEETGGREPTEFSTFGKAATSLQAYHDKIYSRFNETLGQLKKEMGTGIASTNG